MGALGTRHSLRPLFYWANGSCKTSGASRRGNAKVCVKFEPRHCEERSDEAIHSFFARRDGLLRSTRNDGLIKAPRIVDLFSLSGHFPLSRKRFMVTRGFATGRPRVSINIKGLGRSPSLWRAV